MAVEYKQQTFLSPENPRLYWKLPSCVPSNLETKYMGTTEFDSGFDTGSVTQGGGKCVFNMKMNLYQAIAAFSMIQELQI